MTKRFEGHWAAYAPGTGFHYRYRLCQLCGLLRRSPGYKPLIHKGRKP